jgi:hypothetical protein
LQTFRPDDELPGQADQIEGRELCPCPLVAVVIENVKPGFLKLGIEILTNFVGRSVAHFDIDEPDIEGRHRFRPDDAGIVMRGFDDRGRQARNADAIRAHLHWHDAAVGALHLAVHRRGIFGAEKEDMSNLDAARLHPLRLGHFGFEACRIVLFGGGGIFAGPGADQRREIAIIIEVGTGRIHLHEVLVAIDLALAGVGEDDEFVAEIAADRAGLRRHGNRFQTHASEGAQIGDEHPVIGFSGVVDGEVEGIGVLHQKFAAPHHPEAWPDLVAELPLDVVEDARQFLVGLHSVAEDGGDHLLVGRAVEHVALMPVGDAEHLLAVNVVASAFAPDFRGLNGGHQ